jgi:hypothetical protein
MEALCWCRNTIPELGTHSLEAFVHCEHTGFFSSHFSFRCLHVRLWRGLADRRGEQEGSTYHPVRERMLWYLGSSSYVGRSTILEYFGNPRRSNVDMNESERRGLYLYQHWRWVMKATQLRCGVVVAWFTSADPPSQSKQAL